MSMPISHKEVPIRDALLKLRNILKGNAQKHILVIGDVMLDVFISGTTDRVSPEAPVPILKEETRVYQLGGAANTAHNIASLGGDVTLIGVIGDDTEGKKIQSLAREKGIKTKLIVEKDFVTTTKTRAIGPLGHLLRIDTESVLPLKEETEEKLIALISKLVHYEIVVVSDYTKGVMTERVIDALKKRFESVRLYVDTKPSRIHLYKDIGLMKLNEQETKVITGITVSSKQNTETALEAIYKLTNSSVVITRGAKGLAAFDNTTNCIHHIAPIKTAVKDVVGAGDTTLAVLAFMYVHNEDLLHSTHAANYVASKAVAKEGTVALSKEEIFGEEEIN